MMLLVTAWIPARFCTRLDLFALRLKMDRRKALEAQLRVSLEMEDLLRDLEGLLSERE